MNKTKYYRLTHNLDPKIVGPDYPQVDCLSQAIAHSISSWEWYNQKIELSFSLKSRNKFSDFLHTAAMSSFGFLVSQNVKNAFKSFQLMRHQYFNSEIRSAKGPANYFWLHLNQPNLIEQIDYQKSTFYETEYTFREREIELDSFGHYLELKSKDKKAKFGVEIEQIFLSNKFDFNLDLFCFLPFSNDVIISQKLKEKLSEFSGASFDEIYIFHNC